MIDLNQVRYKIEEILDDNKLIDKNGCWNYTKNLDDKYYGKVTIHDGYGRKAPAQTFRIHRLSYWFYKGFDITNSSIQILHKCDNTTCYNPDHLFIGDNSINQQDSLAKNRNRNGNMYKTRCIRHHEFTEENTRITATGARMCRTCDRIRHTQAYLNGDLE